MGRGLTVWRQVDVALDGEEVVALPLRLELGGKLLGRDLGHGGYVCCIVVPDNGICYW